jgi:hypothetical protein
MTYLAMQRGLLGGGNAAGASSDLLEITRRITMAQDKLRFFERANRIKQARAQRKILETLESTKRVRRGRGGWGFGRLWEGEGRVALGHCVLQMCLTSPAAVIMVALDRWPPLQVLERGGGGGGGKSIMSALLGRDGSKGKPVMVSLNTDYIPSDGEEDRDEVVRWRRRWQARAQMVAYSDEEDALVTG